MKSSVQKGQSGDRGAKVNLKSLVHFWDPSWYACTLLHQLHSPSVLSTDSASVPNSSQPPNISSISQIY